MSAHFIAAVRFTKGEYSGAAPLECFCGWQGDVDTFRAHQGSIDGQRPRANRRDLQPDPAPETIPVPAPRSARQAGVSSRIRTARYRETSVRTGGRELFTGCEPRGVVGGRCEGCGRRLMLGGKKTRDGQRRLQHASRGFQ